MQNSSRILGLACRVVMLANLIVKLADNIIILVGGATNYTCISIITITNSLLTVRA